MHYVFLVMLLCEREELMIINRWLDFAEMIYLKGKAITLDNFMSKYTFIIGDEFGTYKSPHNFGEIPVDAIKLDKIQLSTDRNNLGEIENYA